MLKLVAHKVGLITTESSIEGGRVGQTANGNLFITGLSIAYTLENLVIHINGMFGYKIEVNEFLVVTGFFNDFGTYSYPIGDQDPLEYLVYKFKDKTQEFDELYIQIKDTININLRDFLLKIDFKLIFQFIKIVEPIKEF